MLRFFGVFGSSWAMGSPHSPAHKCETHAEHAPRLMALQERRQSSRQTAYFHTPCLLYQPCRFPRHDCRHRWTVGAAL